MLSIWTRPKFYVLVKSKVENCQVTLSYIHFRISLLEFIFPPATNSLTNQSLQ